MRYKITIYPVNNALYFLRSLQDKQVAILLSSSTTTIFQVEMKLQYLMLRLMCAGLELFFLVPFKEGGEMLWLASLERVLDAGWEGGGCSGVSPESEVDGGGTHCHTAESPP